MACSLLSQSYEEATGRTVSKEKKGKVAEEEIMRFKSLTYSKFSTNIFIVSSVYMKEG